MNKGARRFFIALPVDYESSVRSLTKISWHLTKSESFLKVVPICNYHLTAKFLGSLNSEIADTLINSFLLLNQLKKIEVIKLI